MDSVTVEDWGEEICAEGVGVKWKKWTRGLGRGREYACPQGVCSFAKPVHQMDGGSDWCGRLQVN